MQKKLQFYIDGRWVDPIDARTADVVDPATEEVIAQVALNGAPPDFTAPFGGYKRSGNGREWGIFGFEEFLETKAVIGWEA